MAVAGRAGHAHAAADPPARADIACFQEVNGQERPSQPRSLLALAELLAGTNLAGAQLASTRTTSNEVYDENGIW
jgi:hypothetical protein